MHERCLRIVSVLLLTAVGAAMTMAGQRPFMPLTSADGLSDLVVNKIYKDSQGYVWFGTGLALDRFDGVRIKSVPIPGDNLNQKRVKAIADLLHSYDMYLHMDGARLANACAYLNCSMRECFISVLKTGFISLTARRGGCGNFCWLPT